MRRAKGRKRAAITVGAGARKKGNITGDGTRTVSITPSKTRDTTGSVLSESVQQQGARGVAENVGRGRKVQKRDGTRGEEIRKQTDRKDKGRDPRQSNDKGGEESRAEDKIQAVEGRNEASDVSTVIVALANPMKRSAGSGLPLLRAHCAKRGKEKNESQQEKRKGNGLQNGTKLA